MAPNVTQGGSRRTTSHGVSFWVSPDSFAIETNRPRTRLRMARYGPMNRFDTWVLVLDGHEIELGGPEGQDYEFWRERPTSGADGPMQAHWRFSRLKSRGKPFATRADQDFALTLIHDIFGQFDGGWNRARQGEASTATVHFSEALLRDLDRGVYVMEGSN